MAPAPPAALRGDEADLYSQHHADLRRAVARRVRLAPDLIDEACQQAWTILLRRQPDRGPTLFAWLRTVAVHEAYRLSGRARRELSLHTPLPGADGDESLGDRLAAPDVVDRTLEARRAIRALGALPAKQRRYASLRAAGFSYREIVELEGATYTNVNKHLVKARRRLRELRDQAA